MENFPSRLKELRQISGKTQRQVADEIGVTEQAYQKYEYGKRTPTFEIAIKLANCFNITLDLLAGREFQL